MNSASKGLPASAAGRPNAPPLQSPAMHGHDQDIVLTFQTRFTSMLSIDEFAPRQALYKSQLVGMAAVDGGEWCGQMWGHPARATSSGAVVTSACGVRVSAHGWGIEIAVSAMHVPLLPPFTAPTAHLSPLVTCSHGADGGGGGSEPGWGGWRRPSTAAAAGAGRGGRYGDDLPLRPERRGAAVCQPSERSARHRLA